MEQNKTGKYLKYAIGEIILVVVGILIALSINNWNNDRVDRHLEREYLTSLIEDLKIEFQAYENGVLNRFTVKEEALLLAKKYAFGNYKVVDTLAFLNKVGIGGVFSIGSNFAIGSTYQELISTSNFKLIKNDSLKNLIISYYTYRNSVSEYADNLRTGYARYINSLKPFNRENVNQIDSLDIKRMSNRLKTEEFLDLINQELTYAYSFKSRVELLNQMAMDLKQIIEEELDR